jgi:hypothetical protein
MQKMSRMRFGCGDCVLIRRVDRMAGNFPSTSSLLNYIIFTLLFTVESFLMWNISHEK